MNPLLSVKGLTKRYGAFVGCADISFDLYPGEVMGIVGESGSGKSTLLNCMAGHLTPDEGQVVFDTRADGPRDTITMSEPERRMLGRTDWAYVHQHARDGLRMGVSAGGNVGERLMAVGARHYGQIREKTTDWLGRVEIDASRVDDRPTTFSAGCSNAYRLHAIWSRARAWCLWTNLQAGLMFPFKRVCWIYCGGLYAIWACLLSLSPTT